ncbi:MAG: hypothetical protein BWY91_03211 [bacterium ADurb.BinA028]|nr:MAG: hypothetical protein BWY91_03211 [bacterium ADurb.BinA028]
MCSTPPPRSMPNTIDGGVLAQASVVSAPMTMKPMTRKIPKTADPRTAAVTSRESTATIRRLASWVESRGQTAGVGIPAAPSGNGVPTKAAVSSSVVSNAACASRSTWRRLPLKPPPRARRKTTNATKEKVSRFAMPNQTPGLKKKKKTKPNMIGMTAVRTPLARESAAMSSRPRRLSNDTNPVTTSANTAASNSSCAPNTVMPSSSRTSPALSAKSSTSMAECDVARTMAVGTSTKARASIRPNRATAANGLRRRTRLAPTHVKTSVMADTPVPST